MKYGFFTVYNLIFKILEFSVLCCDYFIALLKLLMLMVSLNCDLAVFFV
jgi:hypothetical protein